MSDTPLEELFLEIEYHQVLRAHASLVMRARMEYQELLTENARLREALQRIDALEAVAEASRTGFGLDDALDNLDALKNIESR